MTESEKYTGIQTALDLTTKLCLGSEHSDFAKELALWATTKEKQFVLFMFAVMCFGLHAEAMQRAVEGLVLLMESEMDESAVH